MRRQEKQRETRDGTDYFYRVFEDAANHPPRRLGLVMNLTQETFDLLQGEALEQFLGAA